MSDIEIEPLDTIDQVFKLRYQDFDQHAIGLNDGRIIGERPGRLDRLNASLVDVAVTCVVCVEEFDQSLLMCPFDPMMAIW